MCKKHIKAGFWGRATEPCVMEQHLAGSGWLQYNTAWSGINFEKLETCSSYSCAWNGQVWGEWLTGWENLRTKFLIFFSFFFFLCGMVDAQGMQRLVYHLELSKGDLGTWQKCWIKTTSPKRKPPPKLDECSYLISPSLREMVLPASSLLMLWCCGTGVGFAVGRGGDSGAAVINTQLQGRGGEKIAYFC